MLGLCLDSGPLMNHADESSGGGQMPPEQEKPRITKDGVETSMPMAICGMGLRLPGGSASPEEFFDFLLNKGDARTKVPRSRYNVDAYYSLEKKSGAIASQYGYFLDESVSLGALDSSRFSLTRSELEFADPQQRRLLEVVRETLDEAGEVNLKGQPIGCYVGNMGEDWGEMMNRDPLSHGPNRIDGYNDWMLGNRISYEFGFTGPSMTLRTACSSALIGLSEACAAMQRGAASGAIVAGSTLIMAPGTTQSMSEKGILGPDGSCKTFSADANGYARGEAITAIYIKPLDAAIRDGNPVRGVIRSALTNSDGKTQGITNPNPESHEALVRRTYELAGIQDFSKTAYFECHGTGTAVGDPIETGAVANIFGDEGIHITSVKPNVGHTEGASGLVSLIKAVKSLETLTIPPNIKFNTPNPRIPFQERGLVVPVEPTPFPKDRAERVSVNSFGLGGSNAHVIVDSARSFGIDQKARQGESPSDTQLLLYSASSAPSLKSMIGDYDLFLQKRVNLDEEMDDLAYTLANRREHLTHRAFQIIGKCQKPASMGKKAPAKSPELVMVFTGQGAQWSRMGYELMQREDLSFLSTIQRLDRYLENLADPPSWTIEAELKKTARTSKIQKAELSQPLCTAIQIALVDLFRVGGIMPSAVVGHSSGELAGAYAAGALTAKEAIIGAYERGKAANLQQKKGAMAAIGLGRDEVSRFLNGPEVVVACENSPKSVTLSGDADAVQSVVAQIKEELPDITARLLKVEKAYHSYHMREIGEQYMSAISKHVSGKAAQLPFFSSVSGTGLPETRPLDTKYWRDNLENPVLFSPAVAGLLQIFKNPVFLEVGPHGALAGPARQIFAQEGKSPPYMSSMVRSSDCVESYLSAIGGLFEQNVSMDFRAIFPGKNAMPGLPRYPWNYDKEFWYESRMSKEWRDPQFPRHPLLGRRQLESTDFNPSFRNLINVAEVPWLRDHMLQGSIVFPAAGYMAVVGEAIRQLTSVEDGFSLREVQLSQAMILEEDVETEVVTSLHPHRANGKEDGDWWDFTIASHNGNAWIRHCTGSVSATHSDPSGTKVMIPNKLPRKLSSKKMYDTLVSAGMEYGHRFQRLTEITADTIDHKAEATLTADSDADEGWYHLHPTIIDAALQSGLIAARQGKIDASNCSAMPTLLGDVTIWRADTDQPRVEVMADTNVDPKSGEIAASFQVFANDCAVLDMKSVTLTPLPQEQQSSQHHLPVTARVEWHEHIDFLDLTTLLEPTIDHDQWTPWLNDMFKLCVEYTQSRINALEEKLYSTSTVQDYKCWIEEQFELMGRDSPMLMQPAKDSDLLDRILEIDTSLADSPVAACSMAVAKVAENIDDLLLGKVTGYELLGADDTLINLFNAGSTVKSGKFIKSLAHSKPNLRVLEVGAINGDMTAEHLKSMTLPIGKPMFSKYTFSSHSPDSFGKVKKQFDDIPNMEYRVLNISQDPVEQGFEAEGYDLILATNALHGEKSLNEALGNCRKLLALDGKLLMTELHSDSKWVNYACGFFEDWWHGKSDHRANEPYVTPARWEQELGKAGLDLEAVKLDGEEPMQLSAVYVAARQDAKHDLASEAVTMLCDGSEASLTAADTLAKSLIKHGIQSDRRTIGESLPPSQNIIALLDQACPFLEAPDQGNFEALQDMVADLGEDKLFWITKPSQMKCKDPKFAQIVGASRSIRNEEDVAFATCEVDDFEASLGMIIDSYRHFCAQPKHSIFRGDMEYAIQDGQVHVPRIYPFNLTDEVEKTEDVSGLQKSALHLDPTGSYLIAGGLGGIGSVIALHLAEHGARRIVCLSRNAGSRQEEKDVIPELESLGCEVRLVKGNLISCEDIERAVLQSPNLKGIVHAPMLLADESFRNMSLEQWHKACDPKIKGAWYLHEAAMDHGAELDFFVMLSSMSGLNGQPGQANYSGANTFLDAFAQYRNSLGLAAASIDIGAVADMGYAARDEALLKRLLTNGYSGCTEGEILEAVTAAIQHGKSASSNWTHGESLAYQNTFATGFGSKESLSSPENRSWWKNDVRMAVWHNIEGNGAGSEDEAGRLKALIAQCKQEPELLKAAETRTVLAEEIGRQLMALLLQDAADLDIRMPLTQLGLDSLVGIELRNWWKRTFAFDINVLQLLGMGDLAALGGAAADGMLKAIEG